MDVLPLIHALRLMAVCSYISVGASESLETATFAPDHFCRVPEVSIVVQAAYQHTDVIASVAAAVEDMNDLYEGRFHLNTVSFTNRSKFFCDEVNDETANVAASYYYGAHGCAGTSIFLSPCKRKFDKTMITNETIIMTTLFLNGVREMHFRTI